MRSIHVLYSLLSSCNVGFFWEILLCPRQILSAILFFRIYDMCTVEILPPALAGKQEEEEVCRRFSARKMP